MKISNYKINESSPAFIIAELSANHNNSLEVAIETVRAAKRAGADAIKLQTFTADTITLDSNKKDFKINQGTLWDGQYLYDLYKTAHLPWEWHDKLMKIAKEENLICFSSPFDFSAVDFLEKLDVPAYKIASFEITDIPLIKYVAKKNKPIIISTGIAEEIDIDLAVKACRSVGNHQIAILKCTSSYPAPINEANLMLINDIRKKFNVITGLSDHTLGYTVPIVAVSLGAKIIEKHFILDKSIGGPDASFSMDEKEFKEMVIQVRNAEKSFGTATYNLTEKQKKGKNFSRSLYIVENVKKGDILTNFNIRSIRPGFGLHPKYYSKVIGKKFSKDYEKGTRLDFSCFE